MYIIIIGISIRFPFHRWILRKTNPEILSAIDDNNNIVVVSFLYYYLLQVHQFIINRTHIRDSDMSSQRFTSICNIIIFAKISAIITWRSLISIQRYIRNGYTEYYWNIRVLFLENTVKTLLQRCLCEPML